MNKNRSTAFNFDKRIDLFPPELRTASIVPRWSVVWTLTRDSVANHSYYVAMYVKAIATVIRWLENYPDKMLAMVAWMSLICSALSHDLDETISGDLVAPVKIEILDRNRYDDYIRLKMQERMPGLLSEMDQTEDTLPPELFDQMWSIITVADRLDALLFLIGERRLGNGVVASRIPSALARLEAAWHELPAEKSRLEQLWNTVMTAAIKAHETDGGNGV